MAELEKQDGGGAEGSGIAVSDANLERFHKHMVRTSASNKAYLAKLEAKAKSFRFLHMASIIPQATQGNAEIRHFGVTEGESQLAELKAIFDDAMYYVPPGVYAKLLIDDNTMMTDTMFEKATAFEFLRRAHGNVLVTGLGLGMVLPPLYWNKNVTNVQVIEKSQDVIDLVWPYVKRHNKLHVFCADAFEWHPGPERFDVIWHDIWPTICERNLPKIAKLKRRYGQWLNRENPNRWQCAWVEKRLRRMRRKYDQEIEMMNSIRRGTRGGDTDAEIQGDVECASADTGSGESTNGESSSQVG